MITFTKIIKEKVIRNRKNIFFHLYLFKYFSELFKNKLTINDAHKIEIKTDNVPTI
jgi:hypothetical protein